MKTEDEIKRWTAKCIFHRFSQSFRRKPSQSFHSKEGHPLRSKPPPCKQAGSLVTGGVFAGTSGRVWTGTSGGFGLEQVAGFGGICTKRKSALVLEIIQAKTTVAEASRAYDLSPSEVEGWVDEGKRGMENALRAKPEDVREQYERQLQQLQQAYGQAMLELRARKKLQALLDEEGK